MRSIAADNVVAHRIDHFERAMSGAIAFDVVARNVDGEELRADAAFLERRDVGVAVVLGLADVVAVDGAAGDVVMGVDQEGRRLRQGATDEHR